MSEDSYLEEEAREQALAQAFQCFASAYLWGTSQAVVRLLDEWLEQGPERLRLERQIGQILETSVAGVIAELERALTSQEHSRPPD